MVVASFEQQHKTDDPGTELEAGVAVFGPAMMPHGATFHVGNARHGSVGNYVGGKRVYGDRSLHSHPLWGLGILKQRVSHLWMDRDGYLTPLAVE